MNLVKRHPEAHDAWLHAMGIDVRWRHRSAPAQLETAEVAAPTTHAEPTAQATPAEMARTVPDTTAQHSSAPLPDIITQARYWVVGEHALTQKQAYLLAGMLNAIGADAGECIYSHSTGTANTATRAQLMGTGLAAWPELNTLILSAAQQSSSLDTLEHTTQIILGAALAATTTHERQLGVPSLQAMMEQPELKKDAWAVLKPLRHVST